MKVCYKIVHAYERPQFQQDMTVIMAEEEKDGCPRCNGKVCSYYKTNFIEEQNYPHIDPNFFLVYHLNHLLFV